jgi:type IV secretion system protein VirB10
MTRWRRSGDGARGETEIASPADASGERTAESSTNATSSDDDQTNEVVGERRIPSVNRVRSLQSRVSTLLAIGLLSAIGAVLLFWYYSQALTRGEREQREAEQKTEQRAKGEMALPPLGPIDRPRVVSVDEGAERPIPERLLGPAPPAPISVSSSTRDSRRTYGRSSSKTAEVRTLERRLAGAVLIASTTDTAEGNGAAGRRTGTSELGINTGRNDSVATMDGSELGSMLTPTVTQPTRAHALSSRHLLLPKGTFIDCTLETAIDTTLPGLVTCITATDTFSADGRLVLLDRGTKLIGETGGQVKAGMARVFVLWNEARTPDGVIAPLESPGTDELGRSGLAGRVDRHFLERFGAAMLISVIDSAVQAVARSGSDGAVIVNPSASTQIITEVLRSTINIPPTVLKHQGDRIQVLVARDIDFGSVYAARIRDE